MELSQLILSIFKAGGSLDDLDHDRYGSEGYCVRDNCPVAECLDGQIHGLRGTANRCIRCHGHGEVWDIHVFGENIGAALQFILERATR